VWAISLGGISKRRLHRRTTPRMPAIHQRTNTHDDEESGQETSKVDNTAAGRLHEVILVGGAPADPVGQRCDYVGRYHEQRKVVLEKGGRQDDEEEAYREDLVAPWVSLLRWAQGQGRHATAAAAGAGSQRTVR
jgi:hypothetical protein